MYWLIASLPDNPQIISDTLQLLLIQATWIHDAGPDTYGLKLLQDGSVSHIILKDLNTMKFRRIMKAWTIIFWAVVLRVLGFLGGFTKWANCYGASTWKDSLVLFGNTDRVHRSNPTIVIDSFLSSSKFVWIIVIGPWQIVWLYPI